MTQIKHHPRHTLAAVHTLAANAEQPPENADRIMLVLRMAFEKLKGGTKDHEAFDRLAAAINVGLIRAEQIDPLAETLAESDECGAERNQRPSPTATKTKGNHEIQTRKPYPRLHS